MKWIVVESFPSEPVAAIAKGKLEAAGIPCRTQLNQLGDALLGGFGLQTGPMDLLVEDTHVDAALKLLK